MYPPPLYIAEAESTNSLLQEMLSEQPLPEGFTLYAGAQVAGRGQRGNHWESEAGQNLTFSLLLYPKQIKIEEQFIISQAVSLGIAKVLYKYTSEIFIKWPNDIYWREKKICGILIENALSESGIDYSIIGVGLNVNQEKFLSDAPNPISLALITQESYSLQNLIVELQSSIMDCYKHIVDKRDKIVSEYKSLLFRKEGLHLYEDKASQFLAEIVEIENTGHLILRSETGDLRRYAFKEVKHIL